MMFNMLHWRSTGLLSILFCLDTLSQWCNAECFCQGETYPDYPIVNDVKSGAWMQLHCCIDGVLGFHSDNASIEWIYEGKDLNQSDSSLQSTITCGLQKMQFKEAKKSDAGNYTCTVTTPEGHTGSFTTFVKVHDAEPFKEGPKQISITGCNANPCEIYASEKQPRNFTCKAQVGKQIGGHMPPMLSWSLFRQNKFIRDIRTASTVDGSGTISGSLVIDSVTQEDFGAYQCKVTTHHGAGKATFNLLPEGKIIHRRWKSLRFFQERVEERPITSNYSAPLTDQLEEDEFPDDDAQTEDVEELIEILRNKAEENIDEDKSFFMSLIPSFKKLNDEQKFDVKIEIMNVMKRAQQISAQGTSA